MAAESASPSVLTELRVEGTICRVCGSRRNHDSYSSEELTKLDAEKTARKMRCLLCQALGAQSETPLSFLSRDSYEYLVGFHMHLREQQQSPSIAESAELSFASQQRRSLLFREALKGQVLFYEVIDGKVAPYPKAPRMLRGGALVKPRFASKAAQEAAKHEGLDFGEVLFEYWESEVAAVNYNMIVYTNVLSPRFHFHTRTSPYLLGGPHFLMGATSLFWSMIIQWLSSGNKAVFPLPRQKGQQRMLLENLSMATWRQISNDWTGIFTAALQKPRAILCQWANSPYQTLVSFPKKKSDPDQPVAHGCLAPKSDNPDDAATACIFFHQLLDGPKKVAAKGVGSEILTYSAEFDSSSSEEEDDDDDAEVEGEDEQAKEEGDQHEQEQEQEETQQDAVEPEAHSNVQDESSSSQSDSVQPEE